MSRPASHERLYRLLLHLYPSAFRERFGDEMVQLFGDQLRDARRGGASAGTARTWLRTLGDLAVTAASERARRDRTVAHSLAQPPSMVNRLLGALGILGGALLVAALIPNLPWSWVVFNLRLVLFGGGAIAIVVAVLRLHPDRWRWPSLLVGVPTIVANAWHLVMSVMFVTRPQPPEPDPEFRPIYALAATAMWLTNATFGLVALRVGVVTRWGSLALTAGSLLALTGVGGLGFTRGPQADLVATLTTAGVVLVGVAWIILGLDVAFRRRAPDAASQEAPIGG